MSEEEFWRKLSPEALAAFGSLKGTGGSNVDISPRSLVNWRLQADAAPRGEAALGRVWRDITQFGPLGLIASASDAAAYAALRRVATASGVSSVVLHWDTLSTRHRWRSVDFARAMKVGGIAPAVLAPGLRLKDILRGAQTPSMDADVVVIADDFETLKFEELSLLCRHVSASAIFVVRPGDYDSVALALGDAAASGYSMPDIVLQQALAHHNDSLVLTGLAREQFDLRSMVASGGTRGPSRSPRYRSASPRPRREMESRGVSPPKAKAASTDPHDKPRPKEPRWLLAKVFKLAGRKGATPTAAFQANKTHEIRVLLGTEQKDWLIARGKDPSQSIDQQLSKGTHKLSVIFFVLGQAPQKGKLTLPPEGPSPEPAVFKFPVGAKGSAIQAYISIVHRGRVLQTALLSGRAVSDPEQASKDARITLRLQVVVPGLENLEQRQTFDACLIAAKDKNRKSVAAGFVDNASDKDKAVYFKQPRIEAAGLKIRFLLEKVVTDESAKNDLRSKSSVELLWKLAQEGSVLYNHVGKPMEEQFSGRDLTRIQLVQADPDAFIPLEFVYGLPAPANGAGLCKNWEAALGGSKCTAAHHKEDALGHLKVVCPSGFWGVNKVIERQAIHDLTEEEMKNNDFALRAESGRDLFELAPIKKALFGWSEILDNAVTGTSTSVLESLGKLASVKKAQTWLNWADAVKDSSPELLVLLSHTVDSSLEIGPENSLERATLAQINERYLKKSKSDAPIVFLLGCSTAAVDDQLISFVAHMRGLGAALVVGTITPVLGERSAAVVKAVVAELAKKSSAPRLFGDLMRDVRRDLLAKGELTALCATAYGDAQWRVS